MHCRNDCCSAKRPASKDSRTPARTAARMLRGATSSARTAVIRASARARAAAGLVSLSVRRRVFERGFSRLPSPACGRGAGGEGGAFLTPPSPPPLLPSNGRGEMLVTVFAAVSRRRSAGHVASTSPRSRATRASIGRPPRSISNAGSRPTRRGNRCVPPAPGLMPRFTSGMLKRLPSAANRQWQAIASSRAPPSTWPASAATTGLGESSIAWKPC